MLTDFLELKRCDRRAALGGFTPAPIPKRSRPKSCTNQRGPRLHQTPFHAGTGWSGGQRPSMRQTREAFRGESELCVPKAGKAAFPPKSARWKLLPLAFPPAKAAGFVSDPSIRAQVDF